MKKIKQFEIEHLPIEELKPYRLNAKLHPQEQIKKIIRSIELTGFDQPIVVNKKDYSIIKGHGRLEAAIQMGMVTVPVILLDVSQDVIASACNMFLLTHEWLFVFGESRKRLNRIVPNKLEEYKARHGDDVLEAGIKGKTVREKDGTMSTTKSFAYTHHQLHSVIQQTPEKGSIRKDHPAIMPVGLPQQYIESMTDEGQIVSDCFLGSGTTLIACEKTNRVCYGTELSEKYCDVIITRWEKLTGKTAVLVKNINK